MLLASVANLGVCSDGIPSMIYRLFQDCNALGRGSVLVAPWWEIRGDHGGHKNNTLEIAEASYLASTAKPGRSHDSICPVSHQLLQNSDRLLRVGHSNGALEEILGNALQWGTPFPCKAYKQHVDVIPGQHSQVWHIL